MSGSQPFMYLLLPSMYQQIKWHILPLIHLSTINNIPISLSSSNFTFTSFFFKSCHPNPGEKRKAGPSLYMSMHIF